MKKRHLLILAILLFNSCNKKEVNPIVEPMGNVDPEPIENVDPVGNVSDFENVKVSFNQVNSEDRDNYSNVLQATVTISDNYQISTFGQIGSEGFASGIGKIYTYDSNENTESIMLLDDNNEPSFIYGIDVITGEQSTGVTEFERIDTNSFYVRLYDYDWTNRLGTLLFETVITENGGSFNSSPSFDVSTNSTSKTFNSGKTGQSFNVPIIRLEQEIQKLSNSVLKSNDLIDGWINDLTDFRNNQIPEFLAIAKNVGLVAALGGGAAVLAGVAGAAPLFVGGAAFLATASALEFFISDDFSDFIGEVRNDFSDVRADINSSLSGLVETIQGYGETASNFLNDNLNQLTTSEILDIIEEEELFVNSTDLDDLPDSNGVLQIGLSWNTNNTDIDLFVTDPSGITISWQNPSSGSGGFLDRDDVDGFGPENIFWNGNYPDGIYVVSTNYFGCDSDSCPSTSYSITISDGLGFQQSFTGSLNSQGETDNVTSFAVTNGRISISQ